jgi:NAD(P)-dependent dehydrogenase (short-subunit alcohol dehydrogenase family)
MAYDQAYQCDVSDQAKVQGTFALISEELGIIGGLVCNAGESLTIHLRCGCEAHHVRSGVSVQYPALEITKEHYDEQFGVNVWGVFTCCQAAARYVGATQITARLCSSPSYQVLERDELQDWAYSHHIL